MHVFLLRKKESRVLSSVLAVLMTISIMMTGLVLPIEASAVENNQNVKQDAAQASSANPTDSAGWSESVASTYGIGDGFLGKPCANGEILNDKDLTFAHKKIPFGTWVEFEFNGKRAVARCNDRGPYIDGREFDLGPALTRVLGFSGVHTVKWRWVATPPSIFPILFPVAGQNSYSDSFHNHRSGPPSHSDQHRNAPNNRAHEGIDIFAAKGTPVIACVGGTIECRHGSSAGIYLRLVADDGTKYLYIHLDGYAEGIQEGVRVNAGDVIGFVGNTGNAVSTPPHLHFEIRPPYKHLCNECNPPTYCTPVNPYPSLKAAETGIANWGEFMDIAYSPRLAPRDGSTIFGQVEIKANPLLNVTEVDKIQFFIDGNLVAEEKKELPQPVPGVDAPQTTQAQTANDGGTATTQQADPNAPDKTAGQDYVEEDNPILNQLVSPSTYIWNTEEYSTGLHTVQAKAIDITGNESWSETHSVTVKAQDRTAGENIYATAALVSQKGWADGANAVVLARGDNGAFDDAMVAPALCKKYNAPLLFTDPANLSPETAAEIDRLFQNQNIRRVFIIGQSIAPAIENGLKEKGYTVNRIAGSDKYDTSAKVAQEVGAYSKTAIIVSEFSYENAVAVSSAAFTKQTPILLASGANGVANAVPAQTQEALKNLGVTNTIIIGNESSVTLDVQNWLAGNGYNPRRIGGSDKYETSALIAKDSFFGLSPNEPFIVSTEGGLYTDGLAGGVLAAKTAVAPVLLANRSQPLAPAVKSYLFSHEASEIHLIGGPIEVTGYEYYCISLLAPSDDSSVVGKVNIQINPPMDIAQIVKVQFYIDDVLVAEAPAPGSTYIWNTEEYSTGLHTVQAKAIDITGNESWSETHSVTVKAQDRTAGENIYATAALVSQKGWADGANAVVLARGDNGAFDDAMVAPALCKKYNAPLLFTDPANLSPETAAEIDRLFQNQNIRRVFIIGQSIAPAIENGLKEKGYTVNRIAGSDKYDTSAKVAQEVGAYSKTAIIVSEFSYENAVAVSSAAFTKQTPILLASGANGVANAVPAQTQEALKNLGVTNTIIIGNESSVTLDVQNWLAGNGYNPRRIGGSDKYETSALIAKDSFFGLSPNEPFIVSTEGGLYTDGLAGGVLAAKTAVAPVLLANRSQPLAPAVKSYLFSHEASEIHLIGGPIEVTGYEYPSSEASDKK